LNIAEETVRYLSLARTTIVCLEFGTVTTFAEHCSFPELRAQGIPCGIRHVTHRLRVECSTAIYQLNQFGRRLRDLAAEPIPGAITIQIVT